MSWQVSQERTPHLTMGDRIPYHGCFLSYNLQGPFLAFDPPLKKGDTYEKKTT